MEKKNDYLEKIKRGDAIEAYDFTFLLEKWYNNTNERIGRISTVEFGNQAWIHVIYENNTYHLNADTKREAVKKYLDDCKSLNWNLIDNRRGKRNKVAFGAEEITIAGFYLYLA